MSKAPIDQYLSQVQHAMTGSKKHRKAVLASLRNEIQEHFDEACVTYKELVDHFGTAEEMADEFSSLSDRTKSRKLQKRTIWILVIVAAVLLLACAVAIGIAVWYSNGYTVETVIIDYTSTPPQ